MLQDQMVWCESSPAGPAPAAWWSQKECPTNLCLSCRSKTWSQYTAPPVKGSLMTIRHRYASSYVEVWHSASGRSDGKFHGWTSWTRFILIHCMMSNSMNGRRVMKCRTGQNIFDQFSTISLEALGSDIFWLFSTLSFGHAIWSAWMQTGSSQSLLSSFVLTSNNSKSGQYPLWKKSK